MKLKLILFILLLFSLLIDARKNETVVECIEETATEIKCGEFIYSKEQKDKPGSAMFFVDLLVSLICVVFAGLMSGLTLGLLSLDMLNLEIIRNSGDEKMKKYAEKIIPLIKRKHLLLCTLLIANACAMETLPIFLDKILGPAAAIIISVTCVLLFGE